MSPAPQQGLGAASRAPRAVGRGEPGRAFTSRSIWEGASRTVQIPAWREAEIVLCIARVFLNKALSSILQE